MLYYATHYEIVTLYKQLYKLFIIFVFKILLCCNWAAKMSASHYNSKFIVMSNITGNELLLLFFRDLRHFQQFFSHITTCLIATGSSMLTFIVLPHWSIMPQTLDMIPHPVTLSWHWVDQSYLYTVSLRAKRRAASTILMTLVCRSPGSNTWPPVSRTLPTELPGPVETNCNCILTELSECVHTDNIQFLKHCAAASCWSCKFWWS